MPGARNNQSDKATIKRIRSLAGDIQTATDELGASDQEMDKPQIVSAKGEDFDSAMAQVPLGESVVFAIKSEGDEWLLDVLGVPFGSPTSVDSDKQYFDQSTKFYLDKFPSPPAVYYHGFTPDKRPASEPVFLGSTLNHRVAKEGVWFRVELDQEVDESKRVWEAAKAGNARASSGSIAHLARVTKAGHIRVWPVAELSLFDTAKGRQPANQYAVVLPAIKSLYSTVGLPLEIAAVEFELASEGDEQSDAAVSGGQPATATKSSTGDLTVDEKELQAIVAASVAAALKQKEDEAAAERKRQEDIQSTVAAALKSQADVLAVEHAKQLAEATAGRRLPGGAGEAPVTLKFGDLVKYDDVPLADLTVLAGILGAVKSASKGPGPSEGLLKAMAIRIQDSDEGKTGFGFAKSAMKAEGMPVKSDELNRSTLANYGDEWISVAYSSQLWDKIRINTPIVGKLPTVVVPQGAESVVIPLQGTSPTFYTVAQTTDQAANPGRVTPKQVTSKMGTGQTTLTVNKLGAAVNYTGELEEDSLIPWASELRRDLTDEAAEVIEHIAIDGDTATSATTNINHIGGTPTGNEAYLLMNGFRKLALVTNTANSRSAGALDILDFLETVKLMGLAGRNAYDKSKIGILIDMWTAWKSLELAEVKTRDVFVAPTIENGTLTAIYGYPVIVTPNMHRANQDATYGLKANTSGKVDLTTAANNLTGSILAVRWDQWRFGMKRRMAFEVQRDPLSDSTLIVCMMRVGMLPRDNEASAISYNVGL